ncbi:MAG: ATP-binding cassette domain-containing protein, partial [Clostridia bacterium]
MSSANASGEYILEMNNITKRFPGVTALDSVSFNLKAGEIHALVGENGAGKSTLMKILGGIYQPDEGEIFLNGEKVSLKCSKDALEKKISIIHQELNLVPTLSIAENMFLGKEMVHKPTAILNRKEMQSRANNVMKKLGIDNIDGSELARTVSIAKLQLSEI